MQTPKDDNKIKEQLRVQQARLTLNLTSSYLFVLSWLLRSSISLLDLLGGTSAFDLETMHAWFYSRVSQMGSPWQWRSCVTMAAIILAVSAPTIQCILVHIKSSQLNNYIWIVMHARAKTTGTLFKSRVSRSLNPWELFSYWDLFHRMQFALISADNVWGTIIYSAECTN